MIYVDSKDIFIPILDTDDLGRMSQLKVLQWYKAENMEQPILQVQVPRHHIPRLPLNESFLKLFFLLCGITLAICAFIIIDNGNTLSYDRSPSLHRGTNQSDSSVPKEENEESARRPGKKILIAANYWEQLTMATNSFLDLTALAAYGGRQVVLPFVKNSRF